MVHAGDILWTPGEERVERANVTAFIRWLRQTRGLSFANYMELWQWSVRDVEAFWGAVWEYFEIKATPYTRVLAERAMPGAEWFAGARLNYAENVLRGARHGPVALLHAAEDGELMPLSWVELSAQVRVLATRLRELGVRPGDRVVAWMPNIPQTIIAMLATTAIGAIWACCSPDFGERGVLDRIAQLNPRVLFCIDGYRYGGKRFDRRAELERILAGLDGLEQVIYLPYLDPQDTGLPRADALHWARLLEGPAVSAETFEFEQGPFGQPLWTLFSSGTTGLPKAIVHSHGGILLETMKNALFHFDLHPGERLLFFTTSGWMLWNFVASSLATGAVPILYDGSPTYPAPDTLWRLAAEGRATMLGASPTFVEQMVRAGIVPRERYDLSALRSITLAGSPATPDCMAWFYRAVKEDLWVANGSGGTDCCTGFVGGVPTLPVRAGEIQAPSLGVSVKAFNERGESVLDEVGELVLTEPLPSMPLYFWNDPDNSRYRETYFADFPGVWRHGDFFRINAQGGSAVLGRSDATLNRYGVRIGTAEIYRTLAKLPEIEDSLIVNLDLPDGGFFMPLFVKLAPGAALAQVAERVRETLRREYTARHVPDKVIAVPAIPMTITGKKMEVPVRRILMGMSPEKAANRSAMANPDALDFFIRYVATQQDYRLGTA